jgi:molybdenum cofactor cytidylyltransferase
VSAASRIFGLIPAAGKSVRMGTAKLALPLGERTILEYVVQALRQADIAEVLVVLGPHVAELARPAIASGAQALVLQRETAHMRETIEQGLTWLAQHHQPAPHDWLLLVPADHPTLEAQVIRRLAAARADHTGAMIFVPTYAGRRGHPLLVAWSHVPAIRALPPDEGLNAYVRRQAAATREVPIDTPEVLRDLDTPEDYQRLLSEWSSRGRPGEIR